MSQLDEVTQKNATMVDESSSAIQSLNGETRGLNQLVDQFVLREEQDQIDDATTWQDSAPEPWQDSVSEVDFAEATDDFDVDDMDYEEEQMPRSA